ncbi:MAG: hypothetical protein JW936_09145 [Sedimentisphaerales bacterium]|nr:hypothetical protein [Sedimentisphaerales bacterium]
MKPVFQMLVCLVVVIFAFSTFAAAEFTPWFESWEDGLNTGDWSYSGGDWQTVADANSPDGGYCLEFPGVQSAMVERDFGGMLDAFSLTFYYKGVGNGGYWNQNAFLVYNTNNEGAIWIEFFGEDTGLHITFNQSINYFVSLNKWIKVGLVIRPFEGLFSAYIDDEFVTELALTGEHRQAIDRLTGWHSGNDTHMGYLDAVDVVRVIDCGSPGQAYLTGDFGGSDGVPDCYVGLCDLAILCSNWLTCTDPEDSSCTAWYID